MASIQGDDGTASVIVVAPPAFGVLGDSKSGVGVAGISDDGVAISGASDTGLGVRGNSVSNAGVSGTSSSGSGVAGSSASGIGVFGESTGGPGLSGRSDLGIGVEGESTSGDGGHFSSDATALVADATGASGTPAIFRFQGNNVARIDNAGTGFFNGGTQTGGADVAEFITFGGLLQPGDVVEIDPEVPWCFRRVRTPNSTAVAGVISTDPGVTLNARNAAGGEITGPRLALAGCVPVKASAENGAIRPGNLLVAAGTPGHAMLSPPDPAPGTIVGKALGHLDRGARLIGMLVMLR
jgi:hypothetical protein